MQGNELLLLDIIKGNVDASNRWSVSITALSTMTSLNRNDITAALKNLENERYIDQFVISGTPDEVFGLRLTDKGMNS